MFIEKIAFISTFPPRQCGIATFTDDLIENVSLAAWEQWKPVVIAMTNSEKIEYAKPVTYKIRSDKEEDYILAADHINCSDVDLVCLQHEFGLFGGQGNAGSYLKLLLDHLSIPMVTTFHTVLLEPSVEQYWIVRRITNCSRKVVVMSRRGAQMLRQVYNIPPEKILVIPHGIPDLPFAGTSTHKRMAGLENRTTILTFGLLSRNKGIEVMLKAMTKIVKQIPDALYIVLGATHPNVLKSEGESYRGLLERMVKDLELQENVVFHNKFVNNEELHSYLQMADFYVTPYLSEKQITSGTLAFALGTGRVIISTPYWYAQELLADDHGRLVPFNDFQAIARTIVELKRNPFKYQLIRDRAYAKGRKMAWPVVARAYWKLFTDTDTDVQRRTTTAVPIGTLKQKSFIGQMAGLSGDHVYRTTGS